MQSPLIVVYIAGPFRGSSAWAIHKNVNWAEALAFEVWKEGFVALCPHTNTRNFNGALPDKTWLEGDLELLRRCDVLLTTEDWRRSSGARAEVEYAIEHGIQVYHTLEHLIFDKGKLAARL